MFVSTLQFRSLPCSFQVLACKQGLVFKLGAIILFWCCIAPHSFWCKYGSSLIFLRANGAPEHALDLLGKNPYTEFHGKEMLERDLSWRSVFQPSAPVQQPVNIPLDIAACQVCDSAV